ncbi:MULTISPECIES: hypothetical protein [Bacteria]|uniref:Uncharacterized protein n=1 Tax=Lysobacter enzymogenes TaxID=69 RepID=A0AAU9AJS8_LYSEN|nr:MULTISPECIES: hypothetical protein [Bacteria]TCF47789.1 hypothetical protein MCC10107_1956 [Bifidobacterium longum subsp. longum]BAV99397.1 hypothetical protein LEN_3910 [Lysobacter enzymogenes]
MKKVTLGYAVLLCAASASSHAADGRVCTSDPSSGQEMMKTLDAATVFTCEGMEGKQRISGLYKQGWSVAQVLPASRSDDGPIRTYWVLVIEKR